MKSDMNKDTRAKKDAQRKTPTLAPSYSVANCSTGQEATPSIYTVKQNLF